MLLICLALSSFLSVQSQSFPSQYPYYPHFRDPNTIYFRESVNPISLFLANQTVQPSDEVLKQTFGEVPRKNIVPIENNDETSATRLEGQRILQEVYMGQTVELRPIKQQSGLNSGYNSLLYSVTNFGINLLKKINTVQTGNVVLSPYSITSLLALLQQGAIGQTQKEISTALQMSPTESALAYLEISTEYKKRDTPNILRTASNVFIGDTFNLNNTFKKTAQKNFDSDITPVSFVRPSEVARQINSWVAMRTNNKIDKLISPDSLHESTQVVLVNAIYFKGLWQVPFKTESTKPGEFHLSSGASKTVQFMRMRRLIKTGLDPTINAEVVILPFERNQYSMMIILPSSGGSITGTLASLTDARLMSYLSYSLEETDLELPKFTVRADMDLALLLRDMGITTAFSPYAELNGLGTYRAFSPQISSAIHSAVLSIDEQGGSAVAATAFAAVALSYDEPTLVLFKVDRPFIAVLWDTDSSLPLFMAKIEDPQQ